jgi:hypothetical protein
MGSLKCERIALLNGKVEIMSSHNRYDGASARPDRFGPLPPQRSSDGIEKQHAG